MDYRAVFIRSGRKRRKMRWEWSDRNSLSPFHSSACRSSRPLLPASPPLLRISSAHSTQDLIISVHTYDLRFRPSVSQHHRRIWLIVI